MKLDIYGGPHDGDVVEVAEPPDRLGLRDVNKPADEALVAYYRRQGNTAKYRYEGLNG